MLRFIPFFFLSLLSCFLFWQPVAAANIDVTQLHIESGDDGYRVAANFKFELSHELENLISNGIPLYFVIETEVTRPRWYWFDETAIDNIQSVRISYNLITRQYRASVNGSFAQNYPTLNEALALVRTPSRWLIVDKSKLNNATTYHVAVRIRLDTSKLPKPFQFNALNNSDWRLTSEWKQIIFKADEK